MHYDTWSFPHPAHTAETTPVATTVIVEKERAVEPAPDERLKPSPQAARDDVGERIRDDTKQVDEQPVRLSFDAVRNLINANAFARWKGWDLNAHVVIRLDRAPSFARDKWTGWQSRFLDHLTCWLKRRGIPVAFTWVKEAGKRHTAHLHLLLHLSNFIRQRGPLKRFICKTGGFIADEPGNRAVVVKGGKFGMQVATMQAGALIYTLKTLDPTEDRLGVNVAKYLGIRPHRNGQHITGRLHHASQSIGPTARAAAGWKELRDLSILRVYLHPSAPFTTDLVHPAYYHRSQVVETQAQGVPATATQGPVHSASGPDCTPPYRGGGKPALRRS